MPAQRLSSVTEAKQPQLFLANSDQEPHRLHLTKDAISDASRSCRDAS